MPKTLRGQLVVTYSMLLIIMALLVGLWVWNANRHEQYFERGQSANEALQTYMHLSMMASRYFKQLVNGIVLEQIDEVAIRTTRQNVYQSLTHLTVLTEREIQQAINAEDRAEEMEERQRLARLRQLVDLSRESFTRINKLQAEGRSAEAQALLSQLFKETIDQDFGAIIDKAIRDEHAEMAMVKFQDRRFNQQLTIAAVVTSGFVFVFIASMGWFLLRRLQYQVDELVNGTQRLSNGDLDYRIKLTGPQEFARLAMSFDAMASVLEKQRGHLLQASASLEQKVQERTKELDQANQELCRLDNARKSFFADVSHELRTPLTAIRGEAEVTLRGRDKPVEEYKGSLYRIVELAKQLAKLVDDLLLFARTESVPNRLEVSLFPLDQLLQDVCEENSVLAEKSHLRLSFQSSSPLVDAKTLIIDHAIPRRGDLVLARVESIGHHSGVQLAEGRRATLFVGDEIIVCYGDRYAPDQYEALVPDDLSACHLVAAGGIAAKVCLQHGKMKAPTDIQPLGLLADSNGKRLNVRDFALPKKPPFKSPSRPLTIATVGTSMNAGKTTTAAYLIKGLVNAGFKVGAAKITGTGAPGDMHLMVDAGADPVLDFTDAGFSSTYRVVIKDIEGIFETLTAHLQNAGIDVMVVEVADGLFQKETAALLSSVTFTNQVDGLLLAAADAMGASAGLNWLSQRQLPVLAVSGALSLSPLAMRETADATGLKALGLNELADSQVAVQITEKVTKYHAQCEAV